MKKSKKILIVFLVFITSLIILPFFISVETYLNEAERVASEKVGAPVTIASGRLRLLPSPRLIVNNVSVGKHDDFKVDEVVVIPTLRSLLSATKVIDLKISKPVIKQSAFELISSFSGKRSETSDEPVSVNVRHVAADGLQLDFPDIKLPLLNIDANLTDINALKSVYLESADGTLKAEVTPKDNGQLILVHAQKWQPPTDIPLMIEKAELELQLEDSRLEIPNINIVLYGGQLTGSAAMSWVKGWRTEGKFKVANLSVREPSSLVSKAVYLSGNLSGDGHFSSKAKSAAELADNLHADFKFDVNHGVLHGLDLVKVASLLVQQGAKGGETKFDEFSGLLSVTGKQYHLRDIKISSGLLAASGQVKVKPNKALDGNVEVEIKRSVSLVAVPLEVSGTVSDPVVLPSKAALAGAVAGTAVLGPGVGTSLGIKAGGAVDKLKGLFQSK